MNAPTKGVMAHAACACPVCGGAAQPWLEKSGHALVRCSACGHGFLAQALAGDHVARHYADDYFFGGGDGYPDYLAGADLVRAQARRYAQIVACHAPPGTLADIGAAAGFLLAEFRAAGWSGTGIEPNATMREYGHNTLDLDMQAGDAESFSLPQPVDLVTMIQVVGHLHDLSRALGNVAVHLKPGGLCLVEYWDATSLLARLMGANWYEISPPSVVHWFGPRDLARAFANHGMDQIDQGRPRRSVLGAHVASLLEHKLGQSGALAWARGLTRLIPPRAQIPYPAFDLRWALFKKVRA